MSRYSDLDINLQIKEKTEFLINKDICINSEYSLLKNKLYIYNLYKLINLDFKVLQKNMFFKHNIIDMDLTLGLQYESYQNEIINLNKGINLSEEELLAMEEKRINKLNIVHNNAKIYFENLQNDKETSDNVKILLSLRYNIFFDNELKKVNNEHDNFNILIKEYQEKSKKLIRLCENKM